MCLAIAMYLVTGTLSLISHILLTVGIFLLTLLGKLILMICASIYTVSHRPRSSPQAEDEQQPFVTMYPELYDFDENYEAMKRDSLETIGSTDSSRRTRHHKSRADDKSDFTKSNSELSQMGDTKESINKEERSRKDSQLSPIGDSKESKNKEGRPKNDDTKRMSKKDF